MSVTYCVNCKSEIPEARDTRGSHFCTNECHQAYRKERRRKLATRKCRYCGNGLRRQKQKAKPETAMAQCAGAPSNGVQDVQSV